MIKRVRGFTLLELIVVVIIMAVVMSVLPSIWRGNASKVDGQAQVLSTDLRYIQYLAMTQNQALKVSFTSSTYSFATVAGVAVNRPGTSSATVTLPSGMVLGSTNLPSGYIVFDRSGAPYSAYTDASTNTPLASTATVTLTDSGYTATIQITAGTGFVTQPSVH